MDYLVDTNVLIYTLDGVLDPAKFQPGSWYYFFISEIELLSKPGLSVEQSEIVEELLSSCLPAHFHYKMVGITAELRRKYKVKVPEALIAAAAIFYDLPLLTADKGFSKIDGLNLVLLEI